MKEIKLRGDNDLYLVVDDSDYEEIKNYKWYKMKNTPAVYRYIKSHERHLYNVVDKIYIHRFITQTINSGPDIVIDHIDGNPLNNQASNLRIATRALNCLNRGVQSNNKSSKYKGLTYDKVNNKFRVQIRADKKSLNIGRFNTEAEAALAYNKAAVKHHGEFARLNVISNG